MLTRYEELVVPDRGAHDRFPAAASVAVREGFLEIPIVDAYVELLWGALSGGVAAAAAPSARLRGRAHPRRRRPAGATLGRGPR